MNLHTSSLKYSYIYLLLFPPSCVWQDGLPEGAASERWWAARGRLRGCPWEDATDAGGRERTHRLPCCSYQSQLQHTAQRHLRQNPACIEGWVANGSYRIICCLLWEGGGGRGHGGVSYWCWRSRTDTSRLCAPPDQSQLQHTAQRHLRQNRAA